MMPKAINLHINKIVLHGVDQLNRGQLGLALEQELHRLISNQGLHGSLKQSTFVNYVSARPISINSRVHEKQLGRQIASSVYRGMKR